MLSKTLCCIAVVLLFLGVNTSTAQQTNNNLYPTDSIVSRYHNVWTQGHYRERIAAFKANPLPANGVVFIGNSITEQGEDWSAKYGVTNISNRGIAGDVTDGVLQRLNEITHSKPKAVFMLVGINDLFSLHHKEDNRGLRYDKTVPSVKYIAKNILKIAKLIHKASPETEIYIRTVLPTTEEYLKQDILALNALIHKNATKGNYHIVDLYSVFANANNLMIKPYTRDGVHLTPEGYAQWVQFEKPILAPYIK